MIDLRNCKPGDQLLGRQGSILEYVGPTPNMGLTYLDHVVRYVKKPDGTKYPKKSYGTRTNDGFAFQHKRLPEIDEDIIEILNC